MSAKLLLVALVLLFGALASAQSTNCPPPTCPTPPPCNCSNNTTNTTASCPVVKCDSCCASCPSLPNSTVPTPSPSSNNTNFTYGPSQGGVNYPPNVTSSTSTASSTSACGNTVVGLCQVRSDIDTLGFALQLEALKESFYEYILYNVSWSESFRYHNFSWSVPEDQVRSLLTLMYSQQIDHVNYIHSTILQRCSSLSADDASDIDYCSNNIYRCRWSWNFSSWVNHSISLPNVSYPSNVPSSLSNITATLSNLTREVNIIDVLDVATTLEDTIASAFSGLILTINNQADLALLSSISVVQGRHASFLRLLSYNSPFPGAFVENFSRRQVKCYMARYLASDQYCPGFYNLNC